MKNWNSVLEPCFLKGRRSTSGFTLIEVLVASVVLSFGIVLVLGALNSSLIAIDRARDSAFASYLGRQFLDSAALKLVSGKWGNDIAGTYSVHSPWGGPDWLVETKIIDLSNENHNTGTNKVVEVRIEIKRNGSESIYEHSSYAIAK